MHTHKLHSMALVEGGILYIVCVQVCVNDQYILTTLPLTVKLALRVDLFASIQ